jgi:hypothetical protein
MNTLKEMIHPHAMQIDGQTSKAGIRHRRNHALKLAVHCGQQPLTAGGNHENEKNYYLSAGRDLPCWYSCLSEAAS